MAVLTKVLADILTDIAGNRAYVAFSMAPPRSIF
jgi:hypothetical protein